MSYSGTHVLKILCRNAILLLLSTRYSANEQNVPSRMATKEPLTSLTHFEKLLNASFQEP